MKYLKRFETNSDYESYISSSEYVTPNVSLCDDSMELHYNPLEQHDYSKDYFTTVALESGNIVFSGTSSGSVTNQLSYSTNGGSTWSTPSASITASVSEGDKVLWKCDGTPLSNNRIGRFTSSSTAKFNVEGNVMSLLYGDNFIGQTSLSGKDTAFDGLFYTNTKVISAVNLVLPATTLAKYCYRGMFMGCRSLTEAPKLPATTLADGCYQNMLHTCTSLTVAPELPSTMVVQYCYCEMFNGCTSLQEAPQLSATTLASFCYTAMFNGCTSLSAITCLATNISATNCTSNWLNGVASNGTFTKAASMTSWSRGSNGIPSGWKIKDYGTTTLRIWVDDFTQGQEQIDELYMIPGQSGANLYVYSGDTFVYNGNTYFLWEMQHHTSQVYPIDSYNELVAYILTTTDDYDVLYSESLQYAPSVDTQFSSLFGRMGIDMDELYVAEYPDEVVQLVRVEKMPKMRMWVDDFWKDERGYCCGVPVEDLINYALNDEPNHNGANPYIYYGDTMEYQGNTYYIWELDSDFEHYKTFVSYLLTTTDDFELLFQESLEYNINSHFNYALGFFDKDNYEYREQQIDGCRGNTDCISLLKIEKLDED